MDGRSMKIEKINFLKEIKRIARGQETKAEPSLIAMWAIPWIKAGLETDEVNRLEQMYRLEDPRD
jgi:hypothetical protein